MNVFITSDTHFNHQNIATYCDRPPDFTEIIIKRWHETVKPEDLIIHLGDVQIGKKSDWIMPSLPGRKILVRGNHDQQWSNTRWMSAGFDFSCDGMLFRNCWLSHEPAEKLPEGAILNLHGHLHNIWHGFHPNDPKRGEMEDKYLGETLMTMHKRLHNPWQRLFAIEYTNYRPVNFDDFVSKPDKYQARGPLSKQEK
jgi:calcineurin-like phosphoesterase family protein